MRFAALIVDDLCPRVPPTYPRKRWTGAAESIGALGAMQSCHGLLEVSYTEWVRVLAGKCDETPSHASDAAHPLLALRDDAQGDPAMGDNPEHNAHEPAESALKWAERVAQSRAKGLELVRSRPEPIFIVAQIVNGPLDRLRCRQFAVSAHRWEKKQRAKVAQAIAEGRSGRGARQYRIALSATCEHEMAFLDDVRSLMSEHIQWQTLQPSCRTLELRTLSFRLLSRAAASVHLLLIRVQRAFPYRLFKRIDEPSLALEMQNEPNCRKERFTRGFQETFPDWSLEVVFHVLVALAITLPSDTGLV